MRPSALISRAALACLALCPISFGHAQGPADFYKGRTVDLYIGSLSKHPDLPSVPLVMDFARNGEEKQIFKLVFARQPMGRPFLAPPGIPSDRAAALRKAFMETMQDTAFLTEVGKMKLEINPVAGHAVQQIVREIYQTPKSIADRVADMVNR